MRSVYAGSVKRIHVMGKLVAKDSFVAKEHVWMPVLLCPVLPGVNVPMGDVSPILVLPPTVNLVKPVSTGSAKPTSV